MRPRHHAKGSLLVGAIVDEIDHPHHHAVDAVVGVAVAVLLAGRDRAAVAAGGVASVADADFGVIDRRPLFDDAVDVVHRRLVVEQNIEGRVSVPVVFDDEGLALGPLAVGVIAALGIGVVVSSPAALLARRLSDVRERVFFQLINGFGQRGHLGFVQQVLNDDVALAVEFKGFDFVHVLLLVY